jgi:hypothetical protein
MFGVLAFESLSIGLQQTLDGFKTGGSNDEPTSSSPDRNWMTPVFARLLFHFHLQEYVVGPLRPYLSF